MKVQTGLWLTLLAGSMLANLTVRQLRPPLLPSGPPVLLYDGPRSVSVHQQSYPLRLRVRAADGKEAQVSVWHNGGEVFALGPTAGEWEVDRMLTLRPGANAVEVIAFNRGAEPDSETNTLRLRLEITFSEVRPAPPGPPSPQPDLAGDVLVLVLQTDLLGEGDAYLKKHLAAFQDRNRSRLLGGSIYLLASSGPARAWKPVEMLDGGSAPFHARNTEDLKPTFARVAEALEDFRRRAGGRSFDTLLVWKSDVDEVGAGALADLRKPEVPMMLYWLTERQHDTKGFDEWLGDQAVTCVDPTSGENLAADMKLYLDQKRNP